MDIDVLQTTKDYFTFTFALNHIYFMSLASFNAKQSEKLGVDCKSCLNNTDGEKFYYKLVIQGKFVRSVEFVLTQFT